MKNLIGTAEAARLLGCSQRTVIRRVEAGRLDCAQRLPGPNGSHLFRRSDVEALLADEATS